MTSPAAPRPAPGASFSSAASELPRRAVLLSVALALAAGALVFPALIAHTGGYLFRGDGAAYFMMARSLVVDGDADLTDEYAQLDSRLPPGSDVLMAVRFSARRVPASDRIVLPWPIGGGLVMAPFYAAGYAAELVSARLEGRAPDSYGLLPQVFYGAGALAYGLLGFWATYLGCRRVAGPAAAALSSLAMVLASPALFYILFHPTMSHAASFGLAALLLLMWWRRWQAGAAAGELRLAAPCLLLGLMVLVRYQNAVFAVLPLSLLVRAARRSGRSRGSWPGILRAAAAGALAGLAPVALQIAHLLGSGELAGTATSGTAPAMWRARGGSPWARTASIPPRRASSASSSPASMARSTGRPCWPSASWLSCGRRRRRSGRGCWWPSSSPTPTSSAAWAAPPTGRAITPSACAI